MATNTLCMILVISHYQNLTGEVGIQLNDLVRSKFWLDSHLHEQLTTLCTPKKLLELMF